VNAFNALHAEADFVNVNMLLDCCGDRFPSDSTNLEELRARADRSSRLMEHVAAANAKKFGLVPKAELLELRSLGVNTEGVKMQWGRRRTTSLAAGATAAILLLSLAGGALYLSREFGNANLKLAMMPPASFETVDILFLPKFDRAARLAAGNKGLAPDDEKGGAPKGAAATSVDEVKAGGAGKTLNAAGRDAKIAGLLRKKQGDLGREIAAIEERVDGLQAPILREKKEEISRVQKGREAATDKSQEDFASMRQSRFRSLSGQARQVAEEFVKLLDQTTIAVGQEVKEGIASHTAAIKASPVYQRYGVGWRVNATIGNRVAVSGLKLFSGDFAMPAAGVWTLADAQNFSKFASDQIKTLESSAVVYSATGINIDPPYESSAPLHTGKITKPLHERLKLLANQASGIVAEFQKLETDIQAAQRTQTTKAEERFERQLSEIESKFKERLAQLEVKRAAELRPLEERRASFAQEGKGSLTGSALAELFDELWKSDGVLKTTSASSAFNFGFQPKGDYQVVARAKKATGDSFYSSDIGLPPLYQNIMSIVIPMKVTVMQDGVASQPPTTK
jgi:flagellar motility protein MotE (MotC chaperone)